MKPRGTQAKQILVKWEGRSRAVDLDRQMGEEIKRWLGVESEKGLYMVCDGKRIQWRDLEKTEEGKMVEVMMEMKGGMGKKKNRKNPGSLRVSRHRGVNQR